MNNKQKFKILLNISLCGSIMFMVLSFLGMYYYAGGSMLHNHKTSSSFFDYSYSHTLNFFSDLGLYESWSGDSNIISSMLFSYSLFFVAIGIISFYCALHYILKKDRNLVLLSKLGISVALLSSISFFLVGFTPADLMPAIHMNCVNLAFRSFLFVMLIYSYLIFRSNYVSNYLSVIYLLLFCLVGYYVYIMIAGPKLPPPLTDPKFFSPKLGDLWFHVVSQKFVVYGLSFSILWQLLQLRKEKYMEMVD